MDNVIDLSEYRELKELRRFTTNLYVKLLKTEDEKKDLIEKINHLENILKNLPNIPDLQLP